jgi:phospholipase C
VTTMAKPLPDRIEHIIVVMLENRSFDNVLGGLYPELTRRGLYRGLRGSESNPLDPANPNRGAVTVFQGPATSSIWIMPYPDPGELYTDMVQQIFGSDSVLPCETPPPMSGFAWNYSGQPWSPSGPGWPAVPPIPQDIMQYYSGASMPVTQYLAQQYAVCDGWFAAAPVQTIANRVLTHCGTPGLVPNSKPAMSRVDNPDYTAGLKWDDIHPTVFDTTIFELFDNTPKYKNRQAPCDQAEKLANWKIYYHDAPLSALIDYVWQHWCDVEGGNVYNYQYPWDQISNFEYDIINNLLPAYVFIEPRYTTMNPLSPGYVNSNHPGGTWFYPEDYNGAWQPPPSNVMDGERLLCDIYSTLLRYPQTFENTLLIVTYDEHGGLFDHIPPPCTTSPFTSPVANFDYDRAGVRVPTLLINPSISPGTVYPIRHTPTPPLPSFDHTSILRTLFEQFEIQGDLSPRVDNANPISGLIPPTPIHYDRPPLVCPPAVTTLPPPMQLKGMHPELPQRAHTLAGALVPLYAETHRKMRRRRIRS